MQIDLSSADMRRVARTAYRSLTKGIIAEKFGANLDLGIGHIAKTTTELVKAYVVEILECTPNRSGNFLEPVNTMLKKLHARTSPVTAVAETLEHELAAGLQHVVDAIEAGKIPNFSKSAGHEITTKWIAGTLKQGIMSPEQVYNYATRIAETQKAIDAWAAPYARLIEANLPRSSTDVIRITDSIEKPKPGSVVAGFIAEGLNNPGPTRGSPSRSSQQRQTVPNFGLTA